MSTKKRQVAEASRPEPGLLEHGRRGFKSPTQLPRALWALAHEGVGHRGRASLYGQGGTNGPTAYRGVLGDRATIVPFTTVLTGSQRTTTDNAKAASTCTVLSHRRSQSCPIWLWEQGVAAAPLMRRFTYR
jgi:hypothetical protein